MDGRVEQAWAALRAWLRREPLPRPIHLDVPIESAVKDAEVLLAFAAQSRRSLKEDLITRLTSARDAVVTLVEAKTPVPADKQSKFWFAYDELAVAMAPLSAHSIRSSLRINGTRFPLSLFTAPAALAVVAIIVFFACIVIQSFWVTGRELLDKADQIEAQRVELLKKRAAVDAARMSAEIKLRHFQHKLCDKGQRAGCPIELELRPRRQPSAEEQAEIARLVAQKEVLTLENEERDVALEAHDAEIADLNDRGKSITDLLGRWHGRVTVFCRATAAADFLCLPSALEDTEKLEAAKSTAAKAQKDLDAARANFRALARPPSQAAYDSAEWARYREESSRQNRERAALESAARSAERTLNTLRAEVQRQTAHEVRIILGNLATYIVPLFMGLLGSLAFVLQTLTMQLREHTYVQLSASASIVRLCLGAIAGVFGGLATPASEGVLKGLPPLFIPFVFGYGIEILFSLLNRIVRTFTQSEPKGDGT
jgi:hypothetical protein